VWREVAHVLPRAAAAWLSLRSLGAGPASTLARVTVWRGAARVPPQAAAIWPLLRSLGAGFLAYRRKRRHLKRRVD
jgi:hypothetical protein